MLSSAPHERREPINSEWSADVRAHSGLESDITALPKSASSGLMHRGKNHHYSITSSASSRVDGGTERSSAFAVLRLTTIRYFIGN
jgi:hypothetical protein